MAITLASSESSRAKVSSSETCVQCTKPSRAFPAGRTKTPKGRTELTTPRTMDVTSRGGRVAAAGRGGVVVRGRGARRRRREICSVEVWSKFGSGVLRGMAVNRSSRRRSSSRRSPRRSSRSWRRRSSRASRRSRSRSRSRLRLRLRDRRRSRDLDRDRCRLGERERDRERRNALTSLPPPLSLDRDRPRGLLSGLGLLLRNVVNGSSSPPSPNIAAVRRRNQCRARRGSKTREEKSAPAERVSPVSSPSDLAARASPVPTRVGPATRPYEGDVGWL